MAHLANSPQKYIGLLLPLSAPGAPHRAALSLRNAAFMAMIDHAPADQVIMVRNTRASPEGAQIAAQELIDRGAKFLIGPLSSRSARALADLAQQSQVPTLAFSANPSISSDFVYPLGLTPEEEINRIVSFATERGIRQFSALIPDHPYGTRVLTAFRQAIEKKNARLLTYERYERNFNGIRKAVDRLLPKIADPVRRDEDDTGPQLYTPYVEAILIADGGDMLTASASLLAFVFSLKAPQLLGTSLWDDPDLTSETSLHGGWFTTSPSQPRTEFTKRYQNVYGVVPHDVASLAYDAVAIASRVISEQNPSTPQKRLERFDGFDGVNGRLYLSPGGQTGRTLEIHEIGDGKTRVISNAGRTP